MEIYYFEDWEGWTSDGIARALAGYVRWYSAARLKAFRADGRTVYETIDGRRARLGMPA